MPFTNTVRVESEFIETKKFRLYCKILRIVHIYCILWPRYWERERERDRERERERERGDGIVIKEKPIETLNPQRFVICETKSLLLQFNLAPWCGFIIMTIIICIIIFIAGERKQARTNSLWQFLNVDYKPGFKNFFDSLSLAHFFLFWVCGTFLAASKHTM